MGALARDQRQLVTLNARMRVGDAWYPVVVRNVSARGVMARCATPPVKGACVEVRHKAFGFSGMVLWSSGERFGIRSNQRIAINALIDGYCDQKVGRRRSQRVRISSPARVVLVCRTDGALLLDISPCGARVQLDEPPRIGSYVLLKWDDHECFGQVMWTRAHICGIRFESQLARETLNQARLSQMAPPHSAASGR